MKLIQKQRHRKKWHRNPLKLQEQKQKKSLHRPKHKQKKFWHRRRHRQDRFVKRQRRKDLIRERLNQNASSQKKNRNWNSSMHSWQDSWKKIMNSAETIWNHRLLKHCCQYLPKWHIQFLKITKKLSCIWLTMFWRMLRTVTVTALRYHRMIIILYSIIRGKSIVRWTMR